MPALPEVRPVLLCLPGPEPFPASTTGASLDQRFLVVRARDPYSAAELARSCRPDLLLGEARPCGAASLSLDPWLQAPRPGRLPIVLVHVEVRAPRPPGPARSRCLGCPAGGPRGRRGHDPASRGSPAGTAGRPQGPAALEGPGAPSRPANGPRRGRDRSPELPAVQPSRAPPGGAGPGLDARGAAAGRLGPARPDRAQGSQPAGPADPAGAAPPSGLRSHRGRARPGLPGPVTPRRTRLPDEPSGWPSWPAREDVADPTSWLVAGRGTTGRTLDFGVPRGTGRHVALCVVGRSGLRTGRAGPSARCPVARFPPAHPSAPDRGAGSTSWSPGITTGRSGSFAGGRGRQ